MYREILAWTFISIVIWGCPSYTLATWKKENLTVFDEVARTIAATELGILIFVLFIWACTFLFCLVAPVA